MSKPYNMPLDAKISLLCPAQGFPAPNFRFVSHLNFINLHKNTGYPILDIEHVGIVNAIKPFLYFRTSFKYSTKITRTNKKTYISSSYS